ncbi:MAG TPA: SUKH-3 domain-containing protein [Gemmatimonadaceae bacterium]|nr:SUKH-3 domain-containing protein [Gemmatimonadaceae bacterium]
MTAHPTWSELVTRTMTAAGWYEGRAISATVLHQWKLQLASEGFSMSPAATVALVEFGGIKVEQSGPGIDMARVPFEFDPMLAIGESDRFARFESASTSNLFPLGEAGEGHAFLAISDAGHVFLVADRLYPVGESVEDSIQNLVEGRRFTPRTT